MPAKLHLAENPLALHLLFQRLEGLVDIVIPNENLHEASSYDLRWGWGSAAAISPRLLPDYGRLAESSFGVQRLYQATASTCAKFRPSRRPTTARPFPAHCKVRYPRSRT